jgi:hypothetical protein
MTRAVVARGSNRIGLPPKSRPESAGFEEAYSHALPLSIPSSKESVEPLPLILSIA